MCQLTLLDSAATAFPVFLDYCYSSEGKLDAETVRDAERVVCAVAPVAPHLSPVLTTAVTVTATATATATVAVADTATAVTAGILNASTLARRSSTLRCSLVVRRSSTRSARSSSKT